MANDSVGVAAAASPTNYIDNEQIATGGSPANVDRQRVRIGGAGYTDLADVVTGDTGQGAQVVTSARKEVSFSTTTVQAVASTDCSNYRSVSIHITSQGTSSTITFQCSNDNTNWMSVQLARMGNINLSAETSTTGSGVVYAGTIPGRYFRLNVTGISAGTTAGVVEFFAQPHTQDLPRVYVAGLDAGITMPVKDLTANFGDALSSSSSVLTVLPYALADAAMDRLRTPTTFKTATATASGDTALWTPTSGKKFRLLRFKIEATADAATSGGASIDVVLRDSTTATAAAMSFYAPATSVTTSPGVISTGWIDLGNGILSAAANNVLNINLSAALSSGKVRALAIGTQE